MQVFKSILVRTFDTIRQQMIPLIFLAAIVLNFTMVDSIIPPSESGNGTTYAIFIATELLALYFLLHIAVLLPVKNIRKEIAIFTTGAKKEGGIESPGILAKLIYPYPTYITNFFNNSLVILKKFSDEYRAGRSLKSEVEFAAEIQKHVLAKKEVPIPSLQIVANSKSATEVGGDSYDVIPRDDNYYIYIGDATGHGVASGFVMMITNALISGFSKVMVGGADILARTNEILKPRVKSNILMSLLMVRWNEAERRLFMTGAGHEYLIIYKNDKQRAFKVKSGGVALGMAKDISKALKEVQIDFQPGDIIVMYTDGITEARNGKQQNSLLFGIDRLVQTIESAGIKTAQGVFNQITIELSKFMGYDHKQFDDITLICMQYRGIAEVATASTTISKDLITEWNWD